MGARSPHRTTNALWFHKMRTEVRAPRLLRAGRVQRNDLKPFRMGRNRLIVHDHVPGSWILRMDVERPVVSSTSTRAPRSWMLRFAGSNGRGVL